MVGISNFDAKAFHAPKRAPKTLMMASLVLIGIGLVSAVVGGFVLPDHVVGGPRVHKPPHIRGWSQCGTNMPCRVDVGDCQAKQALWPRLPFRQLERANCNQLKLDGVDGMF